ncbi:MAG: hypothetical protein R3Y21_05760, partial [Mycoplasmatota bacterium]
MEEKRLEIVNGQIVGIIVFTLSTLISLYVAFEQRKKILDPNYEIDQKFLDNLVFFNRIILTIAILYFLYLSYEALQIVIESDGDVFTSSLQLCASILITLAGLISLFVIIYNKASFGV